MTTDTAPASGDVLVLDGAAHVWVSLGDDRFACLTRGEDLGVLDWESLHGTRGITDIYDRHEEDA